MNPSEHRDESSSENPYLASTVDGDDLAERLADSAVKPTQVILPHPHIGWSMLWVIAFWIVQIIVSIYATMVMIAIAMAGGSSFDEMPQALAESGLIMIPIGTFLSVVFAGAVACLFYRRDFGRRLALRPLTWQQWLLVLLSVMPLQIIASEVTNWAAEVLPQFNLEMMADFASNPWPIVFIAACVFPALGEEVFCRGFLGRGLVAHHGVVVGVLLASLLFGIMHIDPVQATGATVLGIGLHFTYLATRSLLAPILIHMLNNALAFLLMRNYETFPIPGLTPLPDGSIVHTPVLLMVASFCTAGCLCVLLYQARTHWILPDGKRWSPGYATAETPPTKLHARAEANRSGLGLALLTVVAYAVLLWTLVLAYQSARS